MVICSIFVFARPDQVSGRSFEVGIFYPDGNQNIQNLTAFEESLGVRFSSCKWYQDWDTPFESGIAKNFADHGCLPELTWQPQASGVGIAYGQVTSGDYDIYLDNFALAIKKFGRPIRISLAPEMNSEWAPWGINKNGNSALAHKQFWHYTINRFRAKGVENVDWIWSPNVRFYGDLCSYQEIYPGDDFVDYVGLDGYNWGTSQSWSVWQSFSEVFGRSYRELASLTSKKILIMEVASAEKGGDKAAWIKQMFFALHNDFPQIAGFTWFSINKETDWRIDSSQNAKNAFIAGMTGLNEVSREKEEAAIVGTLPAKSKVNLKGSRNYQPETPETTKQVSADPENEEISAHTSHNAGSHNLISHKDLRTGGSADPAIGQGKVLGASTTVLPEFVWPKISMILSRETKPTLIFILANALLLACFLLFNSVLKPNYKRSR
jgi:hypothetical protein